MPILLKDVSFSYPGARQPAVDRVSVDIGPAEAVGIIGQNGSGKTTLIRLMNGLITPQHGDVLVDGINTRGCTPRELTAIRRRVGVVFQFAEDCLFAPTVFDEVAFAPRQAGMSPGEVKERVHEALALVGMSPDEVKGRNPLALSGGEKRKVALAAYISGRPPYLVLDEPFTGLDGLGRRAVLNFITRYTSLGNTVVMITHDRKDLAGWAKRILVMDRGALTYDGPATPEATAALGGSEMARLARELEARGLGELPADDPVTMARAVAGRIRGNRREPGVEAK